MALASNEVFFNRVPHSNFAMPLGSIITFLPDPANLSVGRYETDDAAEIAELKNAMKKGAFLIFQDETVAPRSKSANPQEAETQVKAVNLSQAEILRREAAARASAAALNKSLAGSQVGEIKSNPGEGKPAAERSEVKSATELAAHDAAGQQNSAGSSLQQGAVGGIVNSSTITDTTKKS